MEPSIIRKLNEVVINKIAAGEIVQRPANALKELLENSLDAKSTSIQIIIKFGGLKLIQIQDNGTGIRKDDLEIVCERFTTSKLQRFEDLANISTFGFRGEALASISHIAHLTIQTKTSKDICAYRASYENGKIKECPKPCAGNQGTTITVEDLFFNMPQRAKAIKSPNEEFQRISDVVSKYAVHYSNVGFCLKKNNDNVFRTSPKSTKIDNIQTIYGTEIAKQLIQFECNDKFYNFKVNGLITDANYSGKKSTFLIFVNHRLVESNVLKASVEDIYSTYFQKGHFPFVYISIELEPSTVDVNVHPTKHEVKFLNEEEIIAKIKEQIESKLSESRNVRIFYKQTRLSIGNTNNDEEYTKKNSTNDRISAKEMIRTDSKEQKLDKFFASPSNSSSTINLKSNEFESPRKQVNKLISPRLNNSITRKKTKLTSILGMRQKIENACSTKLKNILNSIVFVGVVDKTYSLFQSGTKLFLCDTIEFTRELFYQILIFNFENFERISFKMPQSIKELSIIALNCKESGWTEDDGPKEQLAEQVEKILSKKKYIMDEYFGLKINNNCIETLPMLLENHKPSMCFLPIYILRLATQVEWDDEEQCFETFCRETSYYYSRLADTEIFESTTHKWVIEHVLYPAFKSILLPTNELKKYIFELADLPNLYKVFERC